MAGREVGLAHRQQGRAALAAGREDRVAARRERAGHERPVEPRRGAGDRRDAGGAL